MSFRDVTLLEIKGPFGRRVVGAAGCRGTVGEIDSFIRKLAAIDNKNKTTTQVFNGNRVATAEHLFHAARLALNGHSTHRNLADSLNIELICWVAAERQIERAFGKVGVDKDTRELAVLTIGNSKSRVKNTIGEIFKLGLTPDASVLELKKKKFSILKKIFAISEKELKIAPMQKLVLERVALLALSR